MSSCDAPLFPPLTHPPFLPMSRAEMQTLGWDSIDILLLSGDAYIDHPAFGAALLGRFLTAEGFRVGVCAQPRWERPEEAAKDLGRMGRPRLFVGVTAGALDSMLAHYTAFRKKRHDDAYTPGGRAGARPNRAVIVYTALARAVFPHAPVVLGGIEASLRRAAHYDFWSDALRRPILQDSKADLLVCGMGERALLAVAETARTLAREQAAGCGAERGEAAFPPDFRKRLVHACRTLPGVACLLPADQVPAVPIQAAPDAPAAAAPRPDGPLLLPSFEAIAADPKLLMAAALLQERQMHQGRAAVQRSGDRALVINPPAQLLSEAEMDALYDLPFSRLPHPAYRAPVPAWEMIRASITSHRGCGGGCSFCSLALHQGRRIASRSRRSLLAEAGRIAAGPGTLPPESGGARGREAAAVVRNSTPPRWAGAISDVGGPSANMWQARCALAEGHPPHSPPSDPSSPSVCRRTSCLHPSICRFFIVDQRAGAALLREMAALPGVRHVRVASGVRFDLALTDLAALDAYTWEFTGGQLKVAPEHSEAEVLDLMRKPPPEVFERFLEAFARACKRSPKELYAVPYLMSAFPGCTDAHMRRLGAWLRRRNWKPQQVQCFIPTPGTVATAMFYAGIAPDGRTIHVARTDRERLEQHYLLTGELSEGGRRRERRTKDHHAPERRAAGGGKSREGGAGKKSGPEAVRSKKISPLAQPRKR